MSLFEWLFERNSPGPVGNIKRSEDQDNWPNNLIIVYGILAIIALAAFVWYGMLANGNKYGGYDQVLESALLVLYLFVAATYSVYPDPNNVGYLGGLINNPFRYTDNINRWMVFLFIFLIPGKLIIIPIIKLSKLMYRLYHER